MGIEQYPSEFKNDTLIKRRNLMIRLPMQLRDTALTSFGSHSENPVVLDQRNTTLPSGVFASWHRFEQEQGWLTPENGFSNSPASFGDRFYSSSQSDSPLTVSHAGTMTHWVVGLTLSALLRSGNRTHFHGDPVVNFRNNFITWLQENRLVYEKDARMQDLVSRWIYARYLIAEEPLLRRVLDRSGTRDHRLEILDAVIDFALPPDTTRVDPMVPNPATVRYLFQMDRLIGAIDRGMAARRAETADVFFRDLWNQSYRMTTELRSAPASSQRDILLAAFEAERELYAQFMGFVNHSNVPISSATVR